MSAQKNLRAILSCCVLLCIGLQANAAELSGRVLDTDGLPVANVQLHVNKGLSVQASSDENGRFILKDLPSGFVTVVALHPEKGVVTDRLLSEGSDVILKLAPFSPPFVQDRKLAEKILLELVSWAAGDELLNINAHWNILVPFDLKRAEELSRQADGSLPESFILSAITMLARDDPKAAVEWGLPRLDDIESAALRNMAMITLGKRIADSDLPLANELYERATLLPDLPEEEQVSVTGGLAFELALRLKRPEVPALLENLLKEAKADDAEEEDEEQYSYSAQAHLVGTVAQYDFHLAERTFNDVEIAHQPAALSRMIDVLLREGNLVKAQELLEKLSASETGAGRKFFSSSAINIILLQGKTDPAGALHLARRVTEFDHRPEALAAAAQFQNDVTNIVLLREAATTVLQHRTPIDQLVNIALLAGAKFPELRLDLTKQVEQLWNGMLAEQRDAYWEKNAGNLVALLASHDKLKARLLLEMEWGRIHPVAAKNSKTNLLSSIVYEMATIDFERALQMARSIPEGEMGFYFTRYRAEHGLARRLLIGPEKWTSENGYRWNRLTNKQ